METLKFTLNEDYITLQNILKFENIVGSGGEAKFVITDGQVKVNGEIDTRRGKKLRKGDFVEFNNQKIEVI